MALKWFVKSKYKKVCSEIFNIRYIKNFKKCHNKSILTEPCKVALRHKNILLGIFQKRQRFNEIRTIRAVENCRRLIVEEIESFFEQKERTINSILPEMIRGEKSYLNIFNDNDLEKIYKRIETIVFKELFERFRSLIVGEFRKVNFGDEIPDIFNLIQEYQITKKRTVLITSYMEALSRRTISDSIELIIQNSLIAKLVCNIDISTVLLPKLGINSGLETMELNEELFDRISGAFYSIKVRLIQEMNHQIANIFYETHDLQLDSAIEHKIHLLEEKIAIEIYQTDLLEA